MRRTLLTRLVSVGALATVAAGNIGCSTMNNTEKGALGGGAIGAGAGALIGKATGNTKTGAVIGGLIGAGTGGLLGNDLDRKDAREATARHDQAVQQANQQYAAGQPERLAEVVELVKKGQSEQVVLNHIRANRMQFTLSVADLDYLKSNAVPDRIIAEMQTSTGVPDRVVVRPAPRTVVVQEQVLVPAYPQYYGGPQVIVAPRPYYYRRW